MNKSEIKRIARFMGLEYAVVGCTGTESETSWQRKNRDFMDEIEMNFIGEYLVDREKRIL